MKQQHWILSTRENIHRMRCKFIENDYFDQHEQSSHLRDNINIHASNSTNKNQLNEILQSNLIDENKFLDISYKIRTLSLEKNEKM